jgi:hypothetical protein
VSSERRSTYAAIFELDGDPADVLRSMNADVGHCQPGRVSGGDGHGRTCRSYEGPGAVELIFNPSADDINEVSRFAAIVP